MGIWYDYKKVYRFEINNIIKERNIKTVEELLDLLYGNVNNDFYSDYFVGHESNPYIKTTILQRFNLLWVIPLYLITIPFQYVIRGEVGIKNETKIGILLTKLIGKL